MLVRQEGFRNAPVADTWRVPVLSQRLDGSYRESLWNRIGLSGSKEIALSGPEFDWTYSELLDHSLLVSESLNGSSKSPGGVVAIYTDRNAKIVPALLGTIRSRFTF